VKSLIGFAVLVIVLALAGNAFRRAATIEDRLALAEEQLTTTTQVSPAVDRQLDESVALVAPIPVVGARIAHQVRKQRAEAAYWQGNYAALAPTAGAAAALPEDDPALLLLTANAGFRNAVRVNRTPQTLARSLDEVLKAYTAVLKVDPDSIDAAFNYEYVAKLRTALTAGRGGSLPPPRDSQMQGEEGEPPKGTPESEFKVLVPLRPEERQEQTDPGTGADFKRKG
jgi:hypothetical protein